MPNVYPLTPSQVRVSADDVHRFVKSPTLVSRRLQDLLRQRFIADVLLSQRFPVEGGAVAFESDEGLYTLDLPKRVAPGGEYALTNIGDGVLSTALVDNWGRDSIVTDAAIKRLLRNPLDRALTRLVNTNVRTIDTVALSVITSAITKSRTVSPWSGLTADAILEQCLTGKVAVDGSGEGYDANFIVCDDKSWVAAMVSFAKAGWLPRETAAANPILTGDFPSVAGLTFLKSPNAIAGTALIVDSAALGGMADEDQGGPGYVKATGDGVPPVEVKTIREDAEDRWRIRARRICVPVVTDPGAGYKLQGVSA